MDYTKMKHHTVNSYFLLLCKPSPFHHHFKDTDNVTNIVYIYDRNGTWVTLK